MLIRNFLNRTYFAPDDGAGSAVHDGTEDVVREEVGAAGDPQDDLVEEGGDDGTASEAASQPGDPDGAEEATDDLAAALEAAGLPTDPRALISGLTTLRQQSSEAQQLRAMLWQMTQRQQQQPTVQQKPPEPPKAPWEVPQFDRGMLQMLTTDENGNIVPKPGADPTLADQYRRWNTARESALDKLVNDPYGTLQAGMMPLVQQEAQRIVQEQFQQMQRQQSEAAISQRLAQLNKDPNYVDPMTGMPTPIGQEWNSHFAYARSIGHRDPVAYAESQIDAALLRFKLEQEQQEAANAPPPATPAEKRKSEQLAFLKGRQQPGRGGSMRRKNGAKSPPQDYDVWKKLREDLKDVPLEDLRKN